MSGHGEKLSRKQEALVAALLIEPTHAAAALKAGISEATLHRWLRLPGFRTAALADALLRAIGVDVLDKRLEALQAVLLGRKSREP